MSVSRLKVVYKSPEVDVELDKGIEKFFASIGFVRWASGYDHLAFERDIAFERRTKEEADESERNQEVKLTT